MKDERSDEEEEEEEEDSDSEVEAEPLKKGIKNGCEASHPLLNNNNY